MIRQVDWLHYSELYDVLRAHGFSSVPLENSGILFRHPSGALLPFGALSPDEQVATYHYGAIRAAMDDYAIMTRDAFDLALLQAAHRLPTAA